MCYFLFRNVEREINCLLDSKSCTTYIPVCFNTFTVYRLNNKFENKIMKGNNKLLLQWRDEKKKRSALSYNSYYDLFSHDKINVETQLFNTR